jgi:serine/threonine-protein kinase
MTSESEAIKGRRIDRYELHELIGEGGMGAVYRAVDSRLGRTVALKTVVPQRSGVGLTDELRQRFMREALAASKVEHRNVVQVIDFGVTGDGTPYLVMEYLRGQDLGVMLRKTREPLAVEYVADVMLGVCAALRACHQLGIVHRDLKPSNIFLAETDTGHEIKVLDFGVSKAPMADELTQEGQILGTPQYLSPEQVNGKVGPESDQYALGVLLYVCLTKRLPFEEHQNLSLLRAIEVGRFRGPRAHRSDIPEALEAIVLRAMHTNPDQRFESVHVLGQRLWDFASSRGQVEWKNYYFHSPPVAMPAKSTLRGVPLAPGAAGGAPLASGPAGIHAPARPLEPAEPLAPTEVLGKPESEQPAALSPQLFVSTKLARPVGAGADKEGLVEASGDKSASEGSSERGRRRRWMLLLTAVGLIAVGLYVGRGRLHGDAVPAAAARIPAAEPPAAPIRTAEPAAPSRASESPAPVPAAEPPAPVPAAKPVAPVRTVEPSAPTAIEHTADAQSPGVQPPTPRQKNAGVRRKRATPSRSSPKMGLDKNGIGIPSN